MKLLNTLAPAAALIALPTLGLAQDDGPAPGVNASTDTVFIFNSLLFLIGGYLFWRVDETQGRKEIRNLQDAS